MSKPDVVLVGESHAFKDFRNYAPEIASVIGSEKPEYFLDESYRSWYTLPGDFEEDVDKEIIKALDDSGTTRIPLEMYGNGQILISGARRIPLDAYGRPDKRVFVTDFYGYRQPAIFSMELGNVIRESDMLNTILGYIGKRTHDDPIVVRCGAVHMPILEESLKEYGVNVTTNNLTGINYDQLLELRQKAEKYALHELQLTNSVTMTGNSVQESIKPYREPGAGLQEAATKLLTLYRELIERESH